MLYVNRINVGDIVYFRVNFFGPNCESFIHVNFVSLLLCYSYVAPTFSLKWNKEVLDFKKKKKKKKRLSLVNAVRTSSFSDSKQGS